MSRVRPCWFVGAALCVVSFCAYAAGGAHADSPADSQLVSQHLQRLKQELRTAVQRNQQQAAYLRALIQRLQQLEAQIPGAHPPKVPAAAVPSKAKPAPARRKTPQKTETQRAVYQQENALFVRHLTLEPKLTYTYYDLNQINLSGLLPVPAFFIGTINIQRVKATTLQFDLLVRDGITRRLQATLDLPFLYRSFEFIGAGANVTGNALAQANVSTQPFVQGDVNFGLYYQLAKETARHPNVVWNVQAIAPTGIAPYGIKVIPANPNNANLLVSSTLPTGNGLWGAETGFSFVKTSNPGILFANVGYLHYFPRHFSDIGTTPGAVQPGEVALGDIYQFGLGIAFALNRRMSLSTSYADSLAGRAETKPNGSNWQYAVGTDVNAASFNLGVTYGLSRRETVIANLGIGMTKDAPNVSLSFGIPYSF
ncbi:MAG: transporter [Acidiferrobacteraceae bacterium]